MTTTKLSLRNWRIFNKREFEDELRNINWNNILKPEMKTNDCLNLFYNTTKLLDEMAPFKRLTKKEVSLKQIPWITTGILISMKKRDCLYKDMTKETNNHSQYSPTSTNITETKLYP